MILGPLFDQVFKIGQPKGVSIPDLLGGALKTATDENTTATDDNTDAIKQLTIAIEQAIMQARTASSGGGSSNPGWSGFGSPIDLNLNGFPGSGGGYSPSVIMQGFPGVGLPGMGGSSSGGGLSGIGSYVGLAATLGAGGYSLYEGIHSGGSRGDLQMAASAAAIANKVLPMISPALAVAGPIGMVAAGVLGHGLFILGRPQASSFHCYF